MSMCISASVVCVQKVAKIGSSWWSSGKESTLQCRDFWPGTQDFTCHGVTKLMLHNYQACHLWSSRGITRGSMCLRERSCMNQQRPCLLCLRPMHLFSVRQLCPTLRTHGLYSPPGSSVRGISQARILVWVAISFSRGIFPTQVFNPHLL